MDRAISPHSVTPRCDTLGSMHFDFATECISLSSQSAIPQQRLSPPHTGYSKYSSTKQSPAGSPSVYPDGNRDAVVNALKKLQDRIRQLEVERSAAEGNLRNLATETSRYRNLLNREKATKSRLYEPAQTEVSKNTQEVESVLNCAEHRCELLEKQLEYMRKMVQDAETDKHRLVERQREKESRLIRDDEVLKIRVEKLTEIEREHLKLCAYQTAAEKKIQDLETKLVSEIENRRKVEQELKASLSPEMKSCRIAGRQEDKRRTKKKIGPKAKKIQTSEITRHHYHLKLNEMPFLQGNSTSPSHNVCANVQKVLSLMKAHNNVMCGDYGDAKAENTASSSSRSSESDLNELILQLQDEYAQMGFEHQELSQQLSDERTDCNRDDLERELELFTAKMEIKAEQITQLRQHLQKLETKKKRKVKQRPTTATAGTLSATSKQRNAELRSPHSRTQSANRDTRLKILRDMKKLQSTLRPEDLSWDR